MTYTKDDEHQARDDRAFMLEAIAEAGKADKIGEVPVGAILVAPDGAIVGRGHNCPIALNDPTAHAEIMALRQAAVKLRNYRLNDCVLYVTIEPCLMCAGAVLHARIKRLVYGAPDPKSGAVDSLFIALTDERLNHRVEVKGGVMQEECAQLLRSFFAKKR